MKESGEPALPEATVGLSLAERVYLALRDEILSARLRPGQTILEPMLSERYRVSKTPVREALRLLVHDGLVLVLPRKGYVVRPVGFDDLLDVLALRRVLEPPLAADAARHRLPQQAVEVQRLATAQVASYDQAERSRDEGLEPVAELDISGRFHELIAVISGHSRAATILRSLLDETQQLTLLMPDLLSDWQAVDIEEHMRIAAAIAAADPHEAAAAMAAHLDAARDRMMSGPDKRLRSRT